MTGLLLFCFLVVSLSGARSGAVMLLLILAAGYLLRRKLKMNPIFLILVILIALMPAVVLSLIREGKDFAEIPQHIWLYYGYLLDRAFLVPYKVAVWYLLHYQSHGPIGIEAFPKLAFITGGDPIDVPNQIGLLYSRLHYGYLPRYYTISATAGFSLSSYAYYGLIAFPLALIATQVLDIVLLVYKIVHPSLLIALASTLTIGILKFVQSDYTVVWLTHGFGITIILAIVLSWLMFRRFDLKVGLFESVNHRI